MATIGSILGLLSGIPAIISGVDTVLGVFRGGAPSQAQALTAGQAALLSGGTAGRVLSTGTSVGPIGALAGGGFQTAVEVGTALAPIVAQRLGVPVPAFLQQEAAAGRAGVAGGVRTVTRRQLILMTARSFSPGATAKKIIRSAKECGIELAAATFGLNVLDVCFLLAQPVSRRSRGISAADMRRTRSTIRKVSTIQRQLKALSGPIRRRA